MMKIKLQILLCCILGAMALPTAQVQKGEPQLFAEGIVSTGFDESSIAFSPDGKTAWFGKGVTWSDVSILVFSQLKNGRWIEPEIAPFSGRWRDSTPFISPDGKRLFFSSMRPVEGKTEKTDLDIWFVDKTATGWSEPKNLGLPINSNAQETSPSVDREGALYFTSTRAGGRGSLDIYRSRLVDGKYAEPENMGEAINSAGPDSDPHIDASGQKIFFASNRAGGAGSWDIYVSASRNNRWEAARSLGEAINTRSTERWPALSADGRYLLFTSNRGMADAPFEKARLTYQQLIRKLRSAGNDSTDIYQIELSALKLDQR